MLELPSFCLNPYFRLSLCLSHRPSSIREQGRHSDDVARRSVAATGQRIQKMGGDLR